jgi:hypothetical protein
MHIDLQENQRELAGSVFTKEFDISTLTLHIHTPVRFFQPKGL